MLSTTDIERPRREYDRNDNDAHKRENAKTDIEDPQRMFPTSDN
jgi:hypothetical protein